MEKKQELMLKTTQRSNLEEILVSRIGGAGIQVSPRDCRMFGNGIAISNYTDQIELAVLIYDKIVDCADIYFGIRANQMSDALTKSVVKQIMFDFPELTIDEIEHSFERFVQPKTDWRNITKMELIEPVKKYYLVKQKIKSEISKIQEEDKAKEDGIRRANEFYELSIETYKKSLKEGKWIGDIFMAHTLHRKFRNNFNDDEVNELKKQSMILYNEFQEKNSFLYFAYSKERILANLVLERAILEKWRIKD